MSNLIATNKMIEKLINQTDQLLTEVFEDANIPSVLEPVFGTNFTAEQAQLLTEALQTGEFLEQLNLEIRPANELDGALGAYAESEDKIYLSQSFLTQAPIEETTGVLLEEVGHAIDSRLNEFDTGGDEGDIFASLVQGNELSQLELASLRNENDRETLEIGGEQVVVEQAEFTVTKTDDSGEGSLPSAIAQANSSEGADTITFDSSLSGETINLTSGQLEITDALSIEGLGSNQLTIDAGGNSRVFLINDDSFENVIDVSISGLTISGGLLSGNPKGGGILNEENLTLNNSTVSGNSAESSIGGIFNAIDATLSLNNSTVSSNSGSYNAGGIYNNGTLSLSNSTVAGNSSSEGGGITNNETLSLSNSSVSGNFADRKGGGIENNATLTLSNSSVSGNSASESGGIYNFGATTSLSNSSVSGNSAGGGGGISNVNGAVSLNNSNVSGNSVSEGGGGINNNNGTVNLSNSTISGNSAKEDGGGIANNNNGVLSLSNSTVSGNSTYDDGGGISNFSATISLSNSTVSGNSAKEDGGGIENNNNGTVNLSNSIIANTKNGNDIFNDDDGSTINRQGVNLVEDSSLTGQNIINQDPNLSALQDNGGPTLTQVPLTDSPAIDAGINAAIPTDTLDLDGDGDTEEQIPFDQRGEGFDRVVNGTVDLGAVEVQDTPEATLSINPLNAVKEEGDSGTTSFTFEITRSGDTSGETTVGYAVEPAVLAAVVDGRLGASPDDFAGGEFPSGTVEFAAGETSQTLSIEVAGDNTPEIESEEFQNRDIFNIKLTNPSGNAQIEQATASGEILNDDNSATKTIIQSLEAQNNNINLEGSSTAETEINDFGGQDTYTILSSLEGNVQVTDNDISTINLPEGLTIDNARFLSNGLEFTVNGNNLTLIGTPNQFTFVFGGTPLDSNAGTNLSFNETAQAFGTTVPPASQDTPNQATTTGEINSDGTVDSIETNLTGQTQVTGIAGTVEESVLASESDSAVEIADLEEVGINSITRFDPSAEMLGLNDASIPVIGQQDLLKPNVVEDSFNHETAIAL